MSTSLFLDWEPRTWRGELGDGAGDEARRDGRAVVVQDRDELCRGDVAFVDDQQRAQLRVAVLLDDEDRSCAAMKSSTGFGEGKAAHAQDVELARPVFASNLRRLPPSARRVEP